MDCKNSRLLFLEDKDEKMFEFRKWAYLTGETLYKNTYESSDPLFGLKNIISKPSQSVSSFATTMDIKSQYTTFTSPSDPRFS